jgi:hypothetical protein
LVTLSILATIFSSIQVFKNGFNDHVGIAKVAFPRRTIVREGRHVTRFIGLVHCHGLREPSSSVVTHVG